MFTSPIDSSLQNRDYTLILARTNVDQPTNPPGFSERWNRAEKSVLALARLCEDLDPDGITVYASCQAVDKDCLFRKYEHVAKVDLLNIIEENYPPNAVNLRQVLEDALEDYFNRKTVGQTKPNGEIILMLLDGEPGDRMAVVKTIVNATQRLEHNKELKIGLVQIGDDLIARGFFAALDENLKEAGAKFDIVYTRILETIKPESLTEFLLDVIQD
jgi:hypothetical protein